MTKRRSLWAMALGGAAVVLSLVSLGLAFRSDWSGLVPDVLVGVVGASIIAAAVFYASERSADRRIRAADITAAHNRLLDDLTPLRTLDVLRGDIGTFSAATTRILQLADAVDDDDMRVWFEAERQLALYRLMESHTAVLSLRAGATPDDVLAANGPFLRWVAEFAGNVRYWRLNQMAPAKMLPHAAAIEKMLRKAGGWREDHYPWRSGS